MAAARSSQILLVGQKIRQIRKSRRLTQAELAGRIGVTQSDLSRMESGEYKVGLDTLFKILQVFELPMSRFFEEPLVEPPHKPVPAVPEPGEEEMQILRDLALLPDDARAEVRTFIAFKRMQVESRRPRWKDEDGTPQRPAGAEGADVEELSGDDSD